MQPTSDPSGGIIIGLILFYGFIIVLGLASFVFWIVEIIDVARREFREPNAKIIWLLVVVFLHGLGAIIYYFAGKPTGWLPGQAPLVSNYPPNYPPAPGQWSPPPAGQ